MRSTRACRLFATRRPSSWDACNPQTGERKEGSAKRRAQRGERKEERSMVKFGAKTHHGYLVGLGIVLFVFACGCENVLLGATPDGAGPNATSDAAAGSDAGATSDAGGDADPCAGFTLCKQG